MNKTSGPSQLSQSFYPWPYCLTLHCQCQGKPGTYVIRPCLRKESCYYVPISTTRSKPWENIDGPDVHCWGIRGCIYLSVKVPIDPE